MITGGPSYSNEYAGDVDEGLGENGFSIAYRDPGIVAELAAEMKTDKRAEKNLHAKEKIAIRNAGKLLSLLEKKGCPITMTMARSETGVKLDSTDVLTAMSRLIDSCDVSTTRVTGSNGKEVVAWMLKRNTAEPAEPTEPE